MEHIGMGHVGDCLDGTFSNTILVVSINSTESKSLAEALTVRVKVGAAKDPVIRMIAFDGNAHIGSLMFKDQFATNGVIGSSGELVTHKTKGAAMVDIDGATGVAMVGGTVAGG